MKRSELRSLGKFLAKAGALGILALLALRFYLSIVLAHRSPEGLKLSPWPLCIAIVLFAVGMLLILSNPAEPKERRPLREDGFP